MTLSFHTSVYFLKSRPFLYMKSFIKVKEIEAEFTKKKATGANPERHAAPHFFVLFAT